MYGPLLEALGQGHTVITGNNRLARTLRQVYDQGQAQAGVVAWPSPTLLSWGAWQRALWEESRLRGGTARQRACLSDVATGFLWQRALENCEDSAADLPLGQLARAARRSWGLLNDWQAVATDDWTSAGLSPDQQAFLRWSTEFRRLCDEHGVIDPERLTVCLLEDATAGLFTDLGALDLAGCEDLPPLRRALLDALTQQGVVLTLHHTESRELQDSRSGASFETGEAEIRAAARWARSAYESAPDEVIGVVIPDLANRAASVRRLFLDVFAPDWRLGAAVANVPLNLSYGYPLVNAPIVYTALQILKLLDGDCDFDDLSLVLRSPWLRGGRSEAALRASAEIELREELRPEFPLRDAMHTGLRKLPVFAATLQLLIERSNDRDRRSARDWAHWFTELLQKVGWPAKEELDSETWQTLKAWNEAMSLFATSGQVLGPMTRPVALNALARLLQEKLFQPEGSASGVQVMGMLEAAGHNFDQLWVCGLARELWPPPAKPDPFIPLELQRRLNMPDSSAAVTLHYYAGLSSRLLASSRHSIVSWPAQQEGEMLTVSPLAEPLAVHADTDAVAELWNECQLGSVELQTLSDDPPPPWDSKRVVRGGVSVLNRQAVSPLNAFVESRLGAFEIRRPAIGINAMQRGNITHAALEYFYNAHPSRQAAAALSDEARVALLSAALESAVKHLPGIRTPFVRKLADREIAAQLDRIQNFLEIDFAREDFAVIEREELHEVRIGPLAFRLKLDRLDELADGSHFVIDYKTGTVSRQSWNPAAPRDVQLPLYVTTVVPDAAAIAFAQVATAGQGYDGVGHEDVTIAGLRSPGKKQREQVKYQYSQTDELIESWEELRLEWQKVLEKLADTFAAGDFRLDPRNPNSARGQFAVVSRLYDEGFGVLEDDA